MKCRNFKLWWILASFLVAAAVLLAVFWDAVSVLLAPKSVLTGALTHSAQQLEARFSGSPVLVLGKGLDPEGKQTIQLQMDKTEPLLGSVHYDMTVQTRMAPKQILAQGAASTGGKNLDLELYLDGNFAAVSSGELLDGDYYGITYDRFSQDIRSNSVLAFLLGEDTISEWEDKVNHLQETMSGSIEIPDFSQEDLRMAMMGLMALKPTVHWETVGLTGGERECCCISFQIGGDVILAATDYAGIELPLQLDESSQLTAVFCLADDCVVRMDLQLTGKTPAKLSLVGDTDLISDTLLVEYTMPGKEGDQFLHLKLDTISSNTLYTEEVTIQTEEDRNVVHYSWNPQTGDGRIQRSNETEEYAVNLNLQPTDQGFSMKTEDMEALLAVLGEGTDEEDTPCTMTVAKGSSFDTPEYKNLDQWSMADMLALLGSVGKLLGLNVG